MATQPRISSGEHFGEAARRYPETVLICGQIGGGDWEWQIEALREAPSVYVDTSGSVIDRGMIERCVRDLGACRLLFGTDMSHARGVGELLDADIAETADLRRQLPEDPGQAPGVAPPGPGRRFGAPTENAIRSRRSGPVGLIVRLATMIGV